VEIGAGFGGVAYWISKISPALSGYKVYDLPYANVLQGYFLSKTLSPDQVAFYGEEPKKIQVLPGQEILNLEGKVDLLINQNSFPEMPEEVALSYLRWAAQNVKVLYSYNQESGAPVGEFRQSIVRRLVEKVGGFRRISRSPVWVRKGYVEEFYEMQNL